MRTAKRISHSLLDPWVTTPLRSLYPSLRLPRRLPPEAIVMGGNAAAAGAAGCFAVALHSPIAAVVGGLLTLLYHAADVFDGQHARATNQCRNGGELLDHLCDPVSLSLLATAWAYAAGLPLLAIPAVLIVMTNGLLENLKAKLGADFEVGRFGPTEMKFAIATLMLLTAVLPLDAAHLMLAWTFRASLAAGAIALPLQVVRAVRVVNASQHRPDVSEWETRRAA